MKKLLSILLVIAMMIPVFAYAATPEEVLESSITDGQVLQADVNVAIAPALASMIGNDETTAAVIDLINSLGLSVVLPDAASPLAAVLSINGTTAVDLSVQPVDGSLYLASNLLGDNVLYATEKDITDLTSSMNLEEAMSASFNFEDINTESLMNALMPVMEKMQVVTDFTAPEGIQNAVACMTITMTMDDVANILQGCVDTYASIPAFASAMQQDDTAKNLEESIAAIRSSKEVFPAVNLYIYLTAEEDFAGMTFDMIPNAADQVAVNGYLTASGTCYKGYIDARDQKNSVVIEVSADFLATATNVEMYIKVDDALVFSTTFKSNREYDAADNAARKADLVFSVVQDGQPIDLAMTFTAVANIASGLKQSMVISLSGMDLFSVTIDSHAAAPAAAINTANAIHATEITEEQMESIQGSLMNALFTIIPLLPSQLLSALM